MTLQDRPYAKPSEIRAIRLTCRKCMASIDISPTERGYVPDTCPYCKEVWFQRGSGEFTQLTRLIQALDWLNDRGNEARCRIHFEVTSAKPKL